MTKKAHRNSRLSTRKTPWNKGKLIGQKPPLKLKEIWGIRIRLEIAGKSRDLALFNLAIDSKLRACDLVSLKVSDIIHGNQVASRAIIMQQKTKRPVQFEITKQTRESLEAWIKKFQLRPNEYLFFSSHDCSRHITTRCYALVVKKWVVSVGLDPVLYGTHSLRRSKATLIYRQTKNIRAVQLLLGHTKLESTVRYLGVELDDALALAEDIES